MVFKVLKGQFLPHPLQLPPAQTWKWKLKLGETMRLPKSTPPGDCNAGFKQGPQATQKCCLRVVCAPPHPRGPCHSWQGLFLAVFGFGDQEAGKVLPSLWCLLITSSMQMLLTKMHCHAPGPLELQLTLTCFPSKRHESINLERLRKSL